MALFFFHAEGKTELAVPQELCLSVLGNYRGSYRWNPQSRVSEKDQSGECLAFFFLQYFKTVTAGVRQPGNWVCSSLGYWPATFFLKCKQLRGVICYKRMQQE